MQIDTMAVKFWNFAILEAKIITYWEIIEAAVVAMLTFSEYTNQWSKNNLGYHIKSKWETVWLNIIQGNYKDGN